MLFCVACDTSVAPIVNIKIIMPSATVYTNGNVNVQVAFAGSPNTVALLKNGEVLTNLSAPYAYIWNTSVEPEGDYSLSARATLSSGSVVVSDPVVIHVDRTSPTLLTQSPQPNMQTVDPGVTLMDTFSETIAPSSVTPANFQVKRKRDSTPVTGAIAVNGSKITFVPDVLERSTIYEIHIAGVTDLTGNPITPLISSFTTVEWGIPQLLENDPGEVSASHLAVSTNGDAFAIWVQAGVGVWTSRFTPETGWSAALKI